ncbi:polyserase-2-like [Armigeres subalbatus]|uniref:polyserase-2-like n=1 Tax=Armigeres subalbatus TaxID=124917 RepID=UPI002ED01753
MKTLVTLLVLLMATVNGIESGSFFGSTASEDYYKRSNVFDCLIRYYLPLSENDGTPVFGGQRAFDGEYRHMVAIGWVYNDSIKYLCGGNTIHEKFVLTAAHCYVFVDEVLPTIVRAGDTDLGDNENDLLVQQRNILRVLRHPLHRYSKSYHDIALVELDEALFFNLLISPVCLWLESYIPQEPLNIAGFGEVNLAEGPSSTLQQGYVTLQPPQKCEKMLPSRRIPDGILESQFCASHDTMDTCEGDSGGPIELRRIDLYKQEVSLIVGVTSFGTACGSGSIGVYTKISNYVDWLEEQTNQSYAYDQCVSRILHSKYQPFEISHIPTNTPFPYVHLIRNRSAELEYDCMGTLIDDQFVVTSALCATHQAGSPKFIYVPANEEYVAIDEVIPHPQYAVNSLANDIALIKLTKFLKRDLKPVCLSQPEYSSPNPAVVSFMINTATVEKRNFEYFFKYFLPEKDQCHGSTNEVCMQSNLPLIPNICQVMDGAPILEVNDFGISLLYGISNAKRSKCDGKLRGTLIEPHTEWINSVFQSYILREVLIFT